MPRADYDLIVKRGNDRQIVAELRRDGRVVGGPSTVELTPELFEQAAELRGDESPSTDVTWRTHGEELGRRFASVLSVVGNAVRTEAETRLLIHADPCPELRRLVIEAIHLGGRHAVTNGRLEVVHVTKSAPRLTDAIEPSYGGESLKILFVVASQFQPLAASPSRPPSSKDTPRAIPLRNSPTHSSDAIRPRFLVGIAPQSRESDNDGHTRRLQDPG